jgi:nucleoside-diphosphate-sugar epimerase
VNVDDESQILIDNILEMENLVRKEIKSNLPGVILRFGWFYGYDSHNFIEMVAGNFAIIGDGTSYWNMLRPDDAATAILKVLENYPKAIGHIFNINEPAVMYKDFLEEISKITKKKLKTYPEKWTELSIGATGLHYLNSSVQISAKKAFELLGWQPELDYVNGIKKEIEIMKSQEIKS